MNYAKQTPDGIQIGTARTLWPNTSIGNESAFAASQGFAPVISSLPFDDLTQALQPAPVYELDGAFYDVTVQPMGLDGVQAAVTKLIQSRLDDFAQQRGYDGIMSACTYATSGIPRFATDGKTAIAARDETWSVCYGMLASVQSGGPMPTSSAFKASLPVLAWPS